MKAVGKKELVFSKKEIDSFTSSANQFRQKRYSSYTDRELQIFRKCFANFIKIPLKEISRERVDAFNNSHNFHYTYKNDNGTQFTSRSLTLRSAINRAFDIIQRDVKGSKAILSATFVNKHLDVPKFYDRDIKGIEALDPKNNVSGDKVDEKTIRAVAYKLAYYQIHDNRLTKYCNKDVKRADNKRIWDSKSLIEKIKSCWKSFLQLMNDACKYVGDIIKGKENDTTPMNDSIKSSSLNSKKAGLLKGKSSTTSTRVCIQGVECNRL